MSDQDFVYMDEEEKELIDSIENTPIDQFKAGSPDVRKRIEHTAREYQRTRETKMNIRINQAELDRIKERAEREGLKYQTFVKSVLHKYLTGQLVEADKRAG